MFRPDGRVLAVETAAGLAMAPAPRRRRAPARAAIGDRAPAPRPAASLKSAWRSSRSSSPTDTRRRPGAIPVGEQSASVDWRWVVDGGWATIVWTLPSEAVRSGIAVRR